MELLTAAALAEHDGWIALEPSEGSMAVWMVLALVWWLTAFVLLPILYFTICDGAFGRTIGNGPFSLMVVAAEGVPVGSCFPKQSYLARLHQGHPHGVLPLLT